MTGIKHFYETRPMGDNHLFGLQPPNRVIFLCEEVVVF